MKYIISLFLWLPIFALADVADCGSLQNHFGPFDYRVATAAEKYLVERPHFPPKVEQLQAGNTSYLAADISYTLSVFPNHPRALWSMARLGIRQNTERPAHSTYSVRCWFDRAIRFRPDDPNVRMVYGVYLIKIGKSQDALVQLEIAATEDKDNANLNYNIGLAYFDLKKFDQSLDFAHKAYSLGFPLPGLKNKLVRVGKWRDPASVSESTDSTQASRERSAETEAPTKE